MGACMFVCKDRVCVSFLVVGGEVDVGRDAGAGRPTRTRKSLVLCTSLNSPWPPPPVDRQILPIPTRQHHFLSNAPLPLDRTIRVALLQCERILT